MNRQTKIARKLPAELALPPAQRCCMGLAVPGTVNGRRADAGADEFRL